MEDDAFILPLARALRAARPELGGPDVPANASNGLPATRNVAVLESSSTAAVSFAPILAVVVPRGGGDAPSAGARRLPAARSSSVVRNSIGNVLAGGIRAARAAADQSRRRDRLPPRAERRAAVRSILPSEPGRGTEGMGFLRTVRGFGIDAPGGWIVRRHTMNRRRFHLSPGCTTQHARDALENTANCEESDSSGRRNNIAGLVKSTVNTPDVHAGLPSHARRWRRSQCAPMFDGGANVGAPWFRPSFGIGGRFARAEEGLLAERRSNAGPTASGDIFVKSQPTRADIDALGS